MNGLWNLDPIYAGFEDPAFEQDLQNLKEKAAAFASFTAALTDSDPLFALKQGIILEDTAQGVKWRRA